MCRKAVASGPLWGPHPSAGRRHLGLAGLPSAPPNPTLGGFFLHQVQQRGSLHLPPGVCPRAVCLCALELLQPRGTQGPVRLRAHLHALQQVLGRPLPGAPAVRVRACACVCGHACVCLGWGIHFQVCLRVCVCVCAHVRAVCLLPAVPAHVGGRVHVAGPGRLPLATPSPLLDTQQHVLSLPTALYPRTPRGAQWVTGLHPQGAGKKHSHKARSRW